MATLGTRLKALRLLKGLSQQQEADEMGISKSALNNYENSLRMPKYQVLEKIADYFNLSTDFLLGEITVFF